MFDARLVESDFPRFEFFERGDCECQVIESGMEFAELVIIGGRFVFGESKNCPALGDQQSSLKSSVSHGKSSENPREFAVPGTEASRSLTVSTTMESGDARRCHCVTFRSFRPLYAWLTCCPGVFPADPADDEKRAIAQATTRQWEAIGTCRIRSTQIGIAITFWAAMPQWPTALCGIRSTCRSAGCRPIPESVLKAIAETGTEEWRVGWEVEPDWFYRGREPARGYR